MSSTKLPTRKNKAGAPSRKAAQHAGKAAALSRDARREKPKGPHAIGGRQRAS